MVCFATGDCYHNNSYFLDKFPMGKKHYGKLEH